MTEDGSEFVTGEHVCGHNGSLRPFKPDDGHRGNRCPVAVAERLAMARAEALERARLQVAKGLCVAGAAR